MENLRKPPYSEKMPICAESTFGRSFHSHLIVAFYVFPLISRRNVARYLAAIVPKLELLKEAAGSGAGPSA
jgi:hypothetical protein